MGEGAGELSSGPPPVDRAGAVLILTGVPRDRRHVIVVDGQILALPSRSFVLGRSAA